MARPQSTTNRNLSAKPVSGSGGFFIPQYQMNSIIEGIIQILRKNFEEMIKDLKTGQTRTPPKGIISKIKNFLWGYENPKNPWYLANRLGGLGYRSPMRKEATLHEYQLFSKWVNEYNNINSRVNEERLVLDDMIAPFLAKLEDDIRDYLRSAVQPFYLYQPSFKPETEQSPTTTSAEAPIKVSPSSAPQATSGAPEVVASPPAEVKMAEPSDTQVTAANPKRKGKGTAPKGDTGSRGKVQSRLGSEESLGNEPKNVEVKKKKRILGWDDMGNDSGMQTESVSYTKPNNPNLINEFKNCTLYEKTLVCLERLRSTK